MDEEEKEEILETTKSYFKDLWDEYGEYWEPTREGIPQGIREEKRAEVKELLISGLEKYEYELRNRKYLYLTATPAEIQVCDPQDRITGLVNGKVKEEIPNSTYGEENEAVLLFEPLIYCYRVVGIDIGTYGLEIASIEEGETTTFTAVDIPTATEATHQYTIDWDALSQGEEGVTVKVDADGDGTFEDTFTADDELTQKEFLSATNIPQVPILTPIGLIALLCLLTLIATSTILRQKRR